MRLPITGGGFKSPLHRRVEERVIRRRHSDCTVEVRRYREHQVLAANALGWVDGFVTSDNLFVDKGGNVAPGVDGDAITQWLGDYCKSHPEVNVSNAAEELVLELKAQRR